METDALIDRLSQEVRPVSRSSRLVGPVVGIVAGGVVSLLLIATVLGFRPDLASAMYTRSFWMKLGYTTALGIGAMALTARLARPEAVNLRRYWPVAIPIILLAAVSGVELASAPVAAWPALWLGQSWRRCPWLVFTLSGPIFAGLLWSFRRLAPTNLRAAGAAAGFAAGAWAAALYCLHCPEVSAVFVLIWYTFGITLAAGAGALLGPFALRW